MYAEPVPESDALSHAPRHGNAYRHRYAPDHGQPYGCANSDAAPVSVAHSRADARSDAYL
jgi:hypothetical protein